MPDRIADRDQAIEWARSLLRRDDWVVLDTETTGLEAKDEIIELAAIEPNGAKVFDMRLQSIQIVTTEAFKTHGITNAHLVNAPTITETWPLLSRLIDGRLIVAYNAEFDSRMLRQTLNRYNLPSIILSWSCAMVAYAAFCGEWNESKQDYKWQRLPGAQHGALADCRATLQLIQHMAAALTSAEIENNKRAVAELLAWQIENPIETRSVASIGFYGTERPYGVVLSEAVMENGASPSPAFLIVADDQGREIIRIPAGVDPVPILCDALIQAHTQAIVLQKTLDARRDELAHTKECLQAEIARVATYRQSLQQTWLEMEMARAETAALQKRIGDLYATVMKESVL